MQTTAKIAFAIPKLDAGGPDRVIFELLTGLDRARFRPALMVQETGGRYFDALPADVEVIDLQNAGRYPVRATARALDALRADLVMTTLRMNVTASYARLLQRHRQPLIARQANAVAADLAILKKKAWLKHSIAERIIRFALRHADGVVAQSADMAVELRSQLRPGQALETIGNPVDIGAIVAAAAFQSGEAPATASGSPSLIAVGRLMPQKGFDLLIEAMPAIRGAHPGVHLTIFGEGPDRSALDARIAALGLSAAVTLAGQSDRILAEMAAADLFVSSSRYEGFSNAILEAMALGTPVIATDCPGATREMVLEGETGTLVPTGQADALAAGVLRALAGDRASFSANARALVAARYDRAAICERYGAFFQTVMRGARATR